MHRAGKVDTVENLDPVPLFLLEEVPHLGQHPALGVHHHIGGVGLEELGREPEAGLAGAGGADDAGVEVPGVGRVLGPGVGGEKFRIDFSRSMHYNRATCSSLKRRRTALFLISSVN